MNSTFAALFKKYRLRSEFGTLSELADAMAEEGYVYEYSLYSHWQKGDRIPNRDTLLAIIKLFVKRKGISEVGEINQLLSSTGEGYLTHAESENLPITSNDRSLAKKNNNVLSSHKTADLIEYTTLMYQTIRAFS